MRGINSNPRSTRRIRRTRKYDYMAKRTPKSMLADLRARKKQLSNEMLRIDKAIEFVTGNQNMIVEMVKLKELLELVDF